MEQVWGRRMPDDEFEWWFERGPYGRAAIVLAEDGGTVVGVAAMTALRIVVDGEPQPAGMAVNLATHPGYRGRGIFSRVELEAERVAAEAGSAIGVTFPTAEAAQILANRLGWSHQPSPRVWARPLVGRVRAADVPVEPLERFDARTDEVWRRSSGSYGSHVVRDAEYLGWRYLRSPRGYRCFAAVDGDRLGGFAVLRGGMRRGRLRLAVVADLVAPAGAVCAVRALLRRCAEEARRGADALVALPPVVHRATFARLGFLPTPRTIRFLAKELRPDARLPVRDPWHVSLGDLDFV